MDKESLISALAGLSGSMSYLLLYPLELVKVKIIAGDGHIKNYVPYYSNSREAFISIYRTQGLLSFYKGCHVSLFSSIAWTLYFYIYEKAKKRYISIKDSNPNTYKFIVASEAAILSRIITSPLWTVKTRLILQQNSRNWYGDTFEVIKKIFKVDGIKGYFAGLVPGLMLCSNGIFNLYFYELQKDWIGSQNSAYVGIIGMNSKMISSFLTYPIQLVMIKLQQEQYSETILKTSKTVEKNHAKERFFTGTLNCIKKTFEHEGFKGFYRGLPLQLVRTVPGNGLFFILYEKTLKLLQTN